MSRRLNFILNEDENYLLHRFLNPVWESSERRGDDQDQGAAQSIWISDNFKHEKFQLQPFTSIPTPIICQLTRNN